MQLVPGASLSHVGTGQRVAHASHCGQSVYCEAKHNKPPFLATSVQRLWFLAFDFAAWEGICYPSILSASASLIAACVAASGRPCSQAVSYTHLRAHETEADL
eukprot:3507903-Rhodomonas_salina.1